MGLDGGEERRRWRKGGVARGSAQARMRRRPRKRACNRGSLLYLVFPAGHSGGRIRKNSQSSVNPISVAVPLLSASITFTLCSSHFHVPFTIDVACIEQRQKLVDTRMSASSRPGIGKNRADPTKVCALIVIVWVQGRALISKPRIGGGGV